ncbi:MAG: Na(+)-translocating NADH-quinone reductase subunit A [Bacteroidales bacterium]|nr:Na(+)-translocating NADH-quinone reductase subunit A [Bacteroidales bacterium]
MSKTFTLSKGLDIRLKGEAEKVLREVTALHYAVKPTDLTGVFPRLLVKEGDAVLAGTPLFQDKHHENICFPSPVSGTVAEIKRGDKRALLEIRIEPDGKNGQINFGASDPSKLTKAEITDKLLKSGLWSLIRQRPYGIIANPEHTPKAIHISAFDTAPLAPDLDFVVNGKGDLFQTGLDALAKLTGGKLHLNIGSTTSAKEFLNSRNVEINTFKGAHPAGNVGIQIHHLDPINKGDVVWFAGVQDIITIGHLFKEGVYNPEIIVALAGSSVIKTGYYKTRRGACIYKMVEGNVRDGNQRYISGNVLTGKQIRHDSFIGYYDSLITAIPEGNYHEFLGWALPGLNKLSFSRSFFTWMMPGKKYEADTNLHGGERAFVMTGQFEKVFPMNIYPMQLIKAAIAEDIERMEKLGIYEVEPEDLALCEFIDTSKTEIQTIIRNGLELVRKEMS